MPAVDGGQAYMRKALMIRCLAASMTAQSFGTTSGRTKHLARPLVYLRKNEYICPILYGNNLNAS